MNDSSRLVNSQLIGIFGGTFDPPHIGHLILAEEALFQLGLSQVKWVITPNPPHKKFRQITDVHTRIQLVQASIRSNPVFTISTVDLDRPPPHFAVDTLHLLADEYPGARLVYLIGGDSLHDLPQWYTPDKLLEACHSLGVMRRPGDRVNLEALFRELPSLKHKLLWITTPGLEVSASSIRQKIARNEAFRYYLHPEVYLLIQSMKLYRENEAIY
jgi:nicotinate-nucleotide adenylyltransferase